MTDSSLLIIDNRTVWANRPYGAFPGVKRTSPGYTRHMAPAVLFLLLGIWMQELSLVGIHNAPLVGVLCLVSSAAALAGYRRSAQSKVTTASVLAALGRAAHARTTPRPRPAVRVVR